MDLPARRRLVTDLPLLGGPSSAASPPWPEFFAGLPPLAPPRRAFWKAKAAAAARSPPSARGGRAGARASRAPAPAPHAHGGDPAASCQSSASAVRCAACYRDRGAWFTRCAGGWGRCLRPFCCARSYLPPSPLTTRPRRRRNRRPRRRKRKKKRSAAPRVRPNHRLSTKRRPRRRRPPQRRAHRSLRRL